MDNGCDVDLSTAQKFFKSAASVLEVADSRRREQEMKSSRDKTSSSGTVSSAAGISMEERNGWKEAATLLWRIMRENKLQLLSQVSGDACCLLYRLCEGLLNYASQRLTNDGNSNSSATLLERVTSLGNDHVLSFIGAFCTPSRCTKLMNGDSDAGNDLCIHMHDILINQQHFRWMTAVFQDFCSAAQRAYAKQTGLASSLVCTVREILGILEECSMTSADCARALMHTEPKPLVVNLIHGLRIRIAHNSLIRPHVYDDKPLQDDNGMLTSSVSIAPTDPSLALPVIFQNTESLERLGKGELVDLLTRGRGNVYDELNRKALEVALIVVEMAAGYESPTVITALCLIIELSARSLMPERKDGLPVNAPPEVRIAMYENVISAWRGLCKLLHSTKGCSSSTTLGARRDAFLRHQLKHDMAGSLKQLLENCAELLSADPTLFRVVTLQCTPSVFWAKSYGDACDDSLGGLLGNSGAEESLQNSQLGSELDSTWWYNNKPFITITSSITQVLKGALETAIMSTSLTEHIVESLIQITMRSKDAFVAVEGHYVVQCILSLSLKCVRRSQSTSTPMEAEERLVLLTLLHRVTAALLHLYGKLRVQPRPCDVADIIELPPLLLKHLDTMESNEERELSSRLMSQATALWYTVLALNVDEANIKRSQEVLPELLRNILDDGETSIIQQILVREHRSGADDGGVSASSSGKGELVSLSGNQQLEESDDIVVHLRGVLALLLQRNPRFLSARELEMLLNLVSAKGELLTRLGSASLSCSLSHSEVYVVLEELIRGASPALLLDLLSFLSSQLTSDGLAAAAKYERQVWLFKFNCVDAVIVVMERVLKISNQLKQFKQLIRQLFCFLSVAEPVYGLGAHLSNTNLAQVFSSSLASIKSVEHIVFIVQAVLDAAMSTYDSAGNASSKLNTYGQLSLPHPNCCLRKPVFMELLPPLLRHMHVHASELENDVLRAVRDVLRATAVVRCDALLDWAIEMGHASLVPYLELDATSAEQRLPLVSSGDAEDLKAFWTPILSNAAERSEMRFSWSGGVVITVGEWPKKGFSMASCFRFEEIYPRVNIFQFVGIDGTLRSPTCVFLLGGESVHIEYAGKTVQLSEPGMLKGLAPREWVHFHIVMSVAHTVSVYFNAVKIGTCSLPYFHSGSQALIHIGLVNTVVPNALYSIGNISLWEEELITPQVEAHLAGRSHEAGVCKLLPCEVPREISGSRSVSPVGDCVAHFSPCEVDDGQVLLNTLFRSAEGCSMITAKAIGGCVQPPRCWIDYKSFFSNRGGLMHLLRWIGKSKDSAELERNTSLLCTTLRCTANASATDFRTYAVLHYYLRRSAHLITPAVCDSLVHLATAEVRAGNEFHPFIINRLVFDHLLGDMELLAAMPLESAMHVTERVGKMFDVFSCRFADHNVQYIRPFRFVDGILNSLSYSRLSLPFTVLNRVISNLKHIIIACGFETNLVSSFMTAAAVLTPAEVDAQSKQKQRLKLPRARFTQIQASHKTAYNVSLAILRCLIECSRVSDAFLSVFSRLVDLNWFVVCVSRFAETTCVVYATHLFLGALRLNEELRAEVMQHPATVATALEPHSFSEDLLLLLLGHSVGADGFLDLLHSSKSLHLQLDSALGSSLHDSDTVVTPIFFRLLMLHLSASLTRPLLFRPGPISQVGGRRLLRSFRLFKYLHLAVVCSRLMLGIYVKRLSHRPTGAVPDACSSLWWNPTLSRDSSNTHLPEAAGSASEHWAQAKDSSLPVVTRSLWHRPSFVVVGIATYIWRRVQRSRYARLLRNDIPFLLIDGGGARGRAQKEEMCGTLFILKTLLQISMQPNAFALMTRSPFQVATLAFFGSFLRKEDVMAKSGELASAMHDFGCREIMRLRGAVETSALQKQEVDTDGKKGSAADSIFGILDLKTPLYADSEDNAYEDDAYEESVEGDDCQTQNGKCCRSSSSMESGIRKVPPTPQENVLSGIGEVENVALPCHMSPSLPLTNLPELSESTHTHDDVPQSGTVVSTLERSDAALPTLISDPFESVRSLDIRKTRFSPFARGFAGFEERDGCELEEEEGNEDLLLAETIGSVVRPDVLQSHSFASLLEPAVDILSNIVASSLQAMPARTAPANPYSYGACGYLLFQLILITGTMANEEEGASVLINFFMHQVLELVATRKSPKTQSALQLPPETGGRMKSSLPLSRSTESLADNGQRVDECAASVPVENEMNGGIAYAGIISNIFAFNVCAFNDLLVDLLSFHVVELSTIAPYFVRLLLYARVSWNLSDLLEIRLQIVKICVAAINRKPVSEMSLEEMGLIHTMLTHVLDSPWPMKPLMACLIGSLMRVYDDPSSKDTMNPDSRKRKEVITLCLRRIALVYQGSKDLKKAVTVNSLASRVSIYEGFVSALLSQDETNAIVAFDVYISSNTSKLKAVMSGRLKMKVELAVNHFLKKRSFYVNQMRLFNESYNSTAKLSNGYSVAVLVQAYNGRFSSRVGSIARLQPAQLHWLAVPRSSLSRGDSHLSEAFRIDSRHKRSTILTASTFFANAESDDMKGVSAEDHITILNTSSCEPQVCHISALIPPVAVRCRPYVDCGSVPFIDPRCKVTSSAAVLLQNLLEPNEVLRYISNGFRVNGIHVAPCLILVTNVAVKVFCFSRITEKGDVFLYDYEGNGGNNLGGDCDEETDEVNASSRGGEGGVQKGQKQRSHNTTRGFAVSMTNKLQRFLTDGGTKGRRRREHEEHEDGTKVAQSVRQATGHPCKSLYWCYPVRNIRSIRVGLYMHQDTAIFLDVMYSDGLMLSLVDPRQSMNTRARDEFLEVLQEVIGTQRCTIHDHGKRISNMRNMLAGWGGRSVSTFEYLFFLNRAAGRTILDYNQYPIFPWVIADYRSSTLDLGSDSTYRDLSRPMGAQTKERRRSVEDLYQQMTEVAQQLGDGGVAAMELTQPFHHGTHYSTSGGVLYYLIRMEPFTTFARIFQGGDFDVASRLFDTIDGSFQSCVNGPADCKELTPEFFLDGSFLVNMNRCNFGTKSDGTAVDDVKLPPWAKDSAQVFTAVMRYILESDRVAHSIHHWIDLVFGVCRRGKLAVDCHNVFQRMTYGEEVVKALKESQNSRDIDVIVAEVDNFGQTPMQLFQEHHPPQSDLRLLVSGSSESNPTASLSSGIFTVVSTSSTAKKGDHRYKNSTNTAGSNSSFACNNSIASTSSFASRTVTSKLHGARDPSPKVHLMMEFVAAGRQSRFTLKDLTPGSLMTLPVAAVAFCNTQREPVVGFATTRSGEIACCYRYLIPVDDEDYLICFDLGADTMIYIDLKGGDLLSTMRYSTLLEPSANISCTCVCCRETLVAVGSTTGTIYCLRPSMDSGVLTLSSTLCHHMHAIAGLTIDTKYGRMVSFTVSGNDAPIVWCVQQERVVMLHRLNVVHALGHLFVDEDDSRVVASVIDPLTSNTIVVTRRHLLIFDSNGDRYGVGSLSATEGTKTPMQDNGKLHGAVHSFDGSCTAAITAVTPYNTLEWAYGTQLLLTGHEDGSISLWRAVRLPPDGVTHGNIVSVTHHAVIVDGSCQANLGSVTAMQQQQWGEPAFLIGYGSGKVKALSFATPYGGKA